MTHRDHGFAVADSGEALNRRLAREPALLAYFSTAGCQVCKVLRPKLGALLDAEFPRIARVHVDCGRHPDIAARHGVFSVPTVLVFFDGKEALRKGRSFGLAALAEELRRPYRLLFEEPEA